ncbi:unnamed protein product [marine sediment metagenome]|uniref:Four helix bundle protein n=1 Tax=marine sediment metagenome TaxID=412755 RepID=X1F5D0_9ZZZZ
MPVWQKAMDLAVKVFQITVKLPKSEDYGLTSQIRKSSNSVPGNIAEAFGRNTKKDKRHFYIIARGSSFETQSHLIYGKRVQYFSDEQVEVLLAEYNELIFDLNKILKTLDENY